MGAEQEHTEWLITREAEEGYVDDGRRTPTADRWLIKRPTVSLPPQRSVAVDPPKEGTPEWDAMVARNNQKSMDRTRAYFDALGHTTQFD